ncbi:MAG: flagellar hook-length control protein FliK [Proteobacteria bacterium]|nr:flagellar hook-length control protein FliK [Pseudomonadota bacterium]
MQPVLETLIFRPTELTAAPSSGKAAATGGEASAFDFADLLQPPSSEMPVESGDQPALLSAGIPLPATGNTLPAADDQVLPGTTATSVVPAGQLPALDDLVALRHPDTQVDKTSLSASISAADRGTIRPRLAAGISRMVNGNPEGLARVRPAIEAGIARGQLPIAALRPRIDSIAATRTVSPQQTLSPDTAIVKTGDIGVKSNSTDVALPMVRSDVHAGDAGTAPLAAAVRSNSPQVGESEQLPQKALQDVVSVSTALPKPASSPPDSQASAVLQNSAKPAPPLAPAAMARAYPRNRDAASVPPAPREASFSVPRPTVTLSQPPAPVDGTPAAAFRERGDNRLAGGFAGNRKVALQAVLASDSANRADRATRAIQALPSPKLLTETHAAQPLSSSLVTQPIIATAAVSGINAAPLTPAATTVLAVATPVLDPAWAEAIQDRVLMLAGRNIQTAEIRLNPAELGPLQVRISIDDNSVNVTFSAAHAVTREALEIALPRLKEALSESGMSLTQASVSDQGIANQRNDGNRSTAADPGSSDEETVQEGHDHQSITPRKRAPVGLVDTFA